MIHVSELFRYLERENPNTAEYEVVETLLQAITDWPHEIETVEEFFKGVKDLIGSDIIDKSSIQKAINSLNPSRHLWHLESLTSLEEIIGMVASKGLEDNYVFKLINKIG